MWDFFRDVFESFQNANVTTLGLIDIAFILFITLLLAVVMVLTYRNVYSDVSYSQSYVITLVIVSLITTMIVVTIRSNFAVSLGMVGALSIVRFRTPLKEPLDLGFMFWAVGMGISMGALLFNVAILFSLFIASVILIVSKLRNTSHSYLLIIEYDKKQITSRAVDRELAKLKYVLRSKRVVADNVELILEIKQSEINSDIVNIISSIDGVLSSSLVGFSGEYIE